MAAFLTLLGGIGKIAWGKMRDLERAHTALLTSYVSREDLRADMDKLAAARSEMHQENTRKLERIEDRIEKGLARIHDRIDQLPFRAPDARTRSTDR